MKELMTQVDPPKEASAFERMNGWSLLLFSNKLTHYFKDGRLQGGVLKKRYFLQKFDALNRSC